jgi:acyl-CoA dehydrogenase
MMATPGASAIAAVHRGGCVPGAELHQDLRAAVRELCQSFPDTYWRELDARRAYPEAFVKALTDAGYLAALIPEELGGSGLGVSEASVILEEVNRSGANAGACHAQMYTMGTLLRHGSDAQKRAYLPQIASGALRLQAFGVSEPTTGSDTTQVKTTAVRKGDVYVIRGQKIWISRAEHSDLLLLLVRTTPADHVKKKTDGLSMLLVDMRDAAGRGLTIRPIRTMMNHATTELFFDDLEVPVDALVGEEGKGFRYLLDGLNAERILIAAECIGDGRWFIDRATRYATDRIVFGRPIGQNQGVQFPIARALVNVEAADLMRIRAAELFDKGAACGAEANMAKLLAADASWEAANMAVQTHGGFGFADDYDIERKFRETRLYQVAPISTNLILAYVAEHVLGLPRSY